MKKYLNPKIEVLDLEEKDVIATSSPEIVDPNETPGIFLV